MVFSAAACGLWLTCALRAQRGKREPSWQLQAVLVACAVPLVGLLTYQQGPLLGLAGLICATLVLGWNYLPRLQTPRRPERD